MAIYACQLWSKYTQAWGQFGGGHGGRVPQLFQKGGYNIPCPPTSFYLGFVFGEVSKNKRQKAELLWRLSFGMGSFAKDCLQPSVNRISIKTLGK